MRVALRAKDLSSPWNYFQLIEFCRDDGREDDWRSSFWGGMMSTRISKLEQVVSDRASLSREIGGLAVMKREDTRKLACLEDRLMTSELAPEDANLIRPAVTDQRLTRFIVESNEIEGIEGVRDGELRAYRNFMGLERVQVRDLLELLSYIQDGAELRARPGLDVRVGFHIAPPGGPQISAALDDLLGNANEGRPSAWQLHRIFEDLHPFTDGNGRVGRALYVWMKERHEGGMKWGLGFLHNWYYESLEAFRDIRSA